MAVAAAVGTLLIDTGAIGTTYAVSGLTFQPTAVILWWGGRSDSVDAQGVADVMAGIGFAVSTSDRRCQAVRSQNGAGTSVTQTAYRDDACVTTMTNARAVDGLADLQSMDAGGFTLVIDDAFATAIRASYLALGGDVALAATGQFKNPTGAGNADVTGLSFQPDCVLFLSTRETATPPVASTVDAIMGFGAAVSPSQRGVIGFMLVDAQGTSNTFCYGFDAECLTSLNTPGGTNSTVRRADFVSFLSDGFRLNWLETSATLYFNFFLALKGGQYAVGKLLTQIDTTTSIPSEQLPFAPRAVLFASHNKAKSTQDTPQDDAEWSIGAATSTTSRTAQGFIDRDGRATTICATAIEVDEAYVNQSSAATPVVEGLMDLSSMVSGQFNGFTSIMDDADPSAAFVWYLAVGDAAGATDRGVDLGARGIQRAVVAGRV